MKKTLLLSEFCDKYSLHDTHIHVMIKKKLIPEYVLIKGKKYETRVDESYFIDRKHFVRDIQLFNQDVYYWLSDIYCDMDICRAVNKANGCGIHALNTYLRTALFNTKGIDITKGKVSGAEWAFNKFGRDCVRGAKRVNKKFDLTKHLDRIMNES